MTMDFFVIFGESFVILEERNLSIDFEVIFGESFVDFRREEFEY